MEFIGCESEDYDTNTMVKIVRDGNSADENRWGAHVFQVPGTGQYTLNEIVLGGGTSSNYCFYYYRDYNYWQLTNVDVNGKPDMSAEPIIEDRLLANDASLEAYPAPTFYGCKITMPETQPVLDKNTLYALVVRTTTSNDANRILITDEVPTDSMFNGWWANPSVYTDEPTTEQWKEPLARYAKISNNYYAKIGYTSIESNNKRHFVIPDERNYPLETRNYPIHP